MDPKLIEEKLKYINNHFNFHTACNPKTVISYYPKETISDLEFVAKTNLFALYNKEDHLFYGIYWVDDLD